MKITNKFNLPDAIYQSVVSSIRPPQDNHYSVTQLINPPQIESLRREHYSEIEEDCSDRLWALLGSACHYWLDRVSVNGTGEKRLTIEFGGVILSGQPDLIVNDEIHDYKVTSVWSILLEDNIKQEWVDQLNLYRWLYWKASGNKIDRLKIYAILRDWQSSRILDPAYPAIPFVELSVPVWDINNAEEYVKNAIKEHTAVFPRSCTDKERWAKPTIYAVMREGRKSALRLHESLKEAQLQIETMKDPALSIQERKGGYRRCEEYCSVAGWCLQYGRQ